MKFKSAAKTLDTVWHAREILLSVNAKVFGVFSPVDILSQCNSAYAQNAKFRPHKCSLIANKS